MATKTVTIENCKMTITIREEKNEIDFCVSEGGREIYSEQKSELDWNYMGWLLFEFTRRLNDQEIKARRTNKPYRAWIPLPMKETMDRRKEEERQAAEELPPAKQPIELKLEA